MPHISWVETIKWYAFGQCFIMPDDVPAESLADLVAVPQSTFEGLFNHPDVDNTLKLSYIDSKA